MKPQTYAEAKFERLFQSFGFAKIPRELFVRACSPRSTWTSAGEIIEKRPKQGGVPEWLINHYTANGNAFMFSEISKISACIAEQGRTGLDRFGYRFDLGPDQDDFVIDDCTVAQERMAIILHAFPSINAEIIGEEVMAPLIDVVTTSILPFLSSLTEIDITGWLLPQDYDQ